MSHSLAPHALYRCFTAQGRLLYIGKGINPGTRLADHCRKTTWFAEVRGVTFEWFPSESTALAAERTAIHVERPEHNDIWADDRSPDRAADLELWKAEQKIQREQSELIQLRRRVAELEEAQVRGSGSLDAVQAER